MLDNEIWMSYNLDLLISLYESLKEKSQYNGLLDLETNSGDFIDIFFRNLVFYELKKSEDNDESSDEEIIIEQ